MLGEASERLGVPVVAGVVLLPVGSGARRGVALGATGGLVGVIGAARRRAKERAELGAVAGDLSLVQGGAGYLAVVGDDAVLFDVAVDRRQVPQSLGEVRARFAPGQLRRVELSRTTSQVHVGVELRATVGTRYRYEVPKLRRRDVDLVAGLVGVAVDATRLRPPRREVIAVVVLLVIIAALLAFILLNL